MPKHNRMYQGKREKIEHPFRLLGKTLKIIYQENMLATIFAFLFLIIYAACPTLATYKISEIIDTSYDMYVTGSTDYSAINNVLLIMGGLYLATIISSYLYQLLLVRISQKALDRIRKKIFTHMESLPISYFDKRTTGEIMSLYTNDVDTLRQMASQAIPATVSAFVTFVAVISSMFILSWALALITVVFIVGMTFIIKFISAKSSKNFQKRQKSLSEIDGFVQEMTNGQKVIKVFNHEETSISEFKKINEELEEANFKANFYAIILFPALGNLGNINYAITAMLGSFLAIYRPDLVSLGDIASFLLLNKSFIQPINMIAQQITYVFQGLAGSKRIFDLLEEQSEDDNGYVTLVNVKKDKNGKLIETDEQTDMWAWKNPHHPDGENLTELKGDIQFFNVDFSYVPGRLVLKHINIYANPGQKIAFVGATGAGKTTITNLINRFYDIADGKIRYDGININKICKKDLRHSLAIVLQDTSLFSGTIEENIKYGNDNATHEQVVAAAKLANADGFIKNLPDGYNTVIRAGDGANISQGQAQLISIARAAIMDPPVLILDEATSSIDTYTESLIQTGMDKLMKGRTTFAIAHRLSTVQNSDAIMVLEQGEIIERGNHESLLKEKGMYYQLYTGGLELD